MAKSIFLGVPQKAAGLSQLVLYSSRSIPE
jgi:hypothetical protein